MICIKWGREKEAGTLPLVDGNPTTRQSSALVPITLSEAFTVCHPAKPNLSPMRSIWFLYPVSKMANVCQWRGQWRGDTSTKSDSTFQMISGMASGFNSSIESY